MVISIEKVKKRVSTMPLTQKKFRKYIHSPFTLARDGVTSIVEADGKITIRQKHYHPDDNEDDVIETSAAFILKLYTMLGAERPLEFKFRDITAKLEVKQIIIKQEDNELNFDEVIINDKYITELNKMLRATRTVEYTDVPYRTEENTT